MPRAAGPPTGRFPFTASTSNLPVLAFTLDGLPAAELQRTRQGFIHDSTAWSALLEATVGKKAPESGAEFALGGGCEDEADPTTSDRPGGRTRFTRDG